MRVPGRGGSQVVSVLAFYSDDPSSNPAEAYSFFCKIVFEKNKNEQKEAGLAHFFKRTFSLLLTALKIAAKCFYVINQGPII